MELRDAELHDLIDGSFGDGPEHRPVDDRVTAGRRAVARRRMATAAGTAAVLAIVGAGAWLTGGDADRAGDPRWPGPVGGRGGRRARDRGGHRQEPHLARCRGAELGAGRGGALSAGG